MELTRTAERFGRQETTCCLEEMPEEQEKMKTEVFTRSFWLQQGNISRSAVS